MDNGRIIKELKEL